MNRRLPWTRLQDFYLRLGFLKLLVAALSPERRSATNDTVIRRLEVALFDRSADRVPGRGPVRAVGADGEPKEKKAPSLVEMLVSEATVPSALYAITRGTTYKVLDWGHDMGLVGRANQITERGLLLRALLPMQQAERFLAGEPEAWNPFELSPRERLFFLYQLLDYDLVTVELIEDLGALPADRVLESREAARLTCAALFRVLAAERGLHDARSLQEHKAAVELALVMADEVGAQIPEQWAHLASRVHVQRDRKATARRVLSRQGAVATQRKTTKNADHQTVPRFEQLVDLGFLSKPGADSEDPAEALEARKRWRYRATSTCARWMRAYREARDRGDNGVPSTAFASIAVNAFTPDTAAGAPPRLATRQIGERVWRSYSEIGRPVGLTPVDSLALHAAIDAAADGAILEMSDVHDLLLRIKERGLLTDCVLFAAGNALDTMFVRIRPSFPKRLLEVVDELAGEPRR